MAHLQHIESAARKKLDGPPQWKGFRFEVVVGGYIVTGEIPVGVYSRGPRKGKPKWTGPGTTVVINQNDVDAEIARYISETGNCPDCFGSKEEVVRWSATEGTHKAPCSKCQGTGRAEQTAASTGAM